MRKPIWKRITALALVLALALSLVACGGPGGNDTGKNDPPATNNTDPKPEPAPGGEAGGEEANEAVKKLAGAYAVDITELGMPLTFYLVINEDGTFQLTNQVENGAVTGADKGSGKVGESDGVYMLVYSDSTAEASKTATFQLDGTDLVFVNTLPYGSSNIAAKLDGPEPIYPVAKSMAYSEYLGVYAGAYAKEVAAMGMTIDYEYSLELTYGAEYVFESRFTVMGEDQVYTQNGTFAVADGKLTLTTADGAAWEGAISSTGEIALNIPLSSMSKDGDDITLAPATTADYAGRYSARKAMFMGPMEVAVTASLKLDMLGGYAYSAAIEGQEPYVETGAYVPNADGTLAFTPAPDSAGEAQTVTRSGSDCVTAGFPISKEVTLTTEIVFYSDRVQGSFTAGADDGSDANGLLTLNPDGTYHFTLTKGDAVTEEDGTFVTGAGMAGATVELTSAAGTLSSGSVSDDGINLNYTTPAGESLGFKLAPAPAEETGGMMPGGMGGGMPGGAPEGMGEAPEGMGDAMPGMGG